MAIAAASESSSPLCYNLKWTDAAGIEEEKRFDAITSFPTSHPKVFNQSTDEFCGAILPFTRVPATTQWPVADPNSGVFECQNVSGAFAYYGYNTPSRRSANTGQYAEGTTSIYMVVDDSPEGYMVITSDEPDRAAPENRWVRVGFRGVNLEGAGVDIQLRDDPGDYYTWDTSTATGTIQWWWSQCCTDGAIIGPFPVTNYSMNLDFYTDLGSMNGIPNPEP